MTTPVETVTLGINTTTGATTGTFAFLAGLHYEVHVAFTGANIPANSQTVEITGDAIAGRISLTSLAVTDSAYADAYLVASASADTTLFYQQCANPGSTLRTIPYYLQIKVDGVIRWQIAGTATGSMVKGKTIAQPPFDFTAAAQLAKDAADDAIAAAAESMQSAADAELAATSASVSAGNANASALQAAQSQSIAAQNAEDAANSAANAYDSQTDSAASAMQAASSANSSDRSAEQSQYSADQAAASAATAANYATQSIQAANNAAQSVIDSSQQADRSQNAATAAYDSAVAAAEAAAVLENVTLQTTAPMTGGGLVKDGLTIAMPAADATHDGYMTKEKWAQIGQGGAVASVVNANGLSLTNGVLSLSAASATTAGGLSAANWITFNAKLDKTSADLLYDQLGSASTVQGNLNTHAGLTTTAHGGIVPDSRTVNGKALSSNISLTYSDVGAEQSGICLKLDQTTPQTIINGSPTVAQGLQIGLTPTLADPVPVGLVYWDDSEGTLNYGITGGDITIGEEVFGIYIDINENLAAGDTVSVVGVSGNRTAVAKTDATSTASATACIGMVTETGLAGHKVRVTKLGSVHDLDTHLLTEGLPIYVNPAIPGGWTQTYPAAPNYAITVGVVTVSHNGNGVIDIQPGYAPRMQDLSDVNGTALTVSGQIAVWDNTGKYFDFTANINDYLKAETDTLQTVTTRGASTTVNLSINGASDATEFTLQSFAGQTATTAVTKIGNVSGGSYFSVFPQGNVSSIGGTTTGITDILFNPAVKASGNFVDFQVGGVSKCNITYGGVIVGSSLGISTIYAKTSATTLELQAFGGGDTSASATGITAFRVGVLGTVGNKRTGGDNIWLQINAVWNQATGTAANCTQELNITNTAVGSGEQLARRTKVNTVVISKEDILGNYIILSDTAGLKLGAGVDMLVSYDGTIGKIDTSLVAASDLHITTGTAKTLVLDTVVYKDQLGAALSLQQTGSGISRNIPEGTVDYTTAANQADYMIENFQFNHDRKAATPVSVHIHWMQAETNTPNWAIQYRWQLGGTAKTTAWTAAKWTGNAFTWATGTINQITSFAALTPASNEGLSPILQVRFLRDTANQLGLSFAADPYTATVAVIAVDAHYQIDTHGSRLEYAK